jgi:hypothetical protein
MSVVSHLSSLHDKHSQLENRIADEYAHPLPNLTLVTKLKKQKLAIKEEIMRLEADTLQKKAS